jgi:hypothetical protein
MIAVVNAQANLADRKTKIEGLVSCFPFFIVLAAITIVAERVFC